MMCCTTFFRNVTVLIAILIFAHPVNSLSIRQHEQTASGAPGWLLSDDNIEIQLNPLRKEQVRAFYLGRGFSTDAAESIANSCVFQTVIKNTSSVGLDISIDVNRDNWVVIDTEGRKKLAPKSVWMDKWQALGESEAAKIAFRWAIFPIEQTFPLTGDYAWGMILFEAKLGEPFAVELEWKENNESHRETIEGLRCLD